MIRINLDREREIYIERIFVMELTKRGCLTSLPFLLEKSFILSIIDIDGRFVFVNRNFCEMSKYDLEELIGQTHQMVNSHFHQKNFFEDLRETVKHGEIWSGDIKYKAKDGAGYWINTTVLPSINQASSRFIAIGTDITHRKETELQVQRMVYYDHLTGLPNRRFFQQEVETLLKKATLFSILFIDLDRFKKINDSMGHSIGDELLTVIGERLKSYVRKEDLVARFGGDEFVVLLPISNETEAEEIAHRIIEGMSEAITVQNVEILNSLSIGSSSFPESGNDFDTLIENADLAMYKAKEKGGSGYQLFTRELKEGIMEKAAMKRALRQALEKDQFELHYQPKFNLKTKEITGAEALIRWRHPTKGIIPSVDFISIAEETGLIIPIGKWVLETVCLQAKAWGENRLQISVNVSLLQLTQSFFVEQVKEALNHAGLNPKYLNVEITESIISEKKNYEVTVRQLREIGVDVSIDDFGTGHSSLISLSEFPITHLKIGRVFIRDLSKRNRAIVKTITDLAKNLDLKVIAEGIETKEQEAFLLEVGCDEVQGYYYAKPLEDDQIEKYF